MINPNISLAVETPQVADPLKTAAEGLSVRGMRQQQESGALSLEQQRQDLADSQVIRQLYGKHKGDLEAVTKEAAGQVSPKSILALQKATIDHKEAMAKLDETQLKNLETHNKLAANESGGILAAPPEARAAMYPAAVQRMVQSGAVKPGELPEQYPGDEAVQNFFDTHAGYQHVFDREKETRAATLATNKDRREAAVEGRASMMAPDQVRELKAKADSAQSDAAIKQFELDAAKATPDQQAAKVAASIDPAKYPEVYKRTLANVTSGVTHQEKMSALHAGSAEVAEREKETDPKIRAARTQQAVDTERALSPLKISQAVQTEVAKAKLAPESFSVIVDPRARAMAEANYEKDSKEYADKVSESRRLKDLINSAQGGNKAAPGLIPIEELRGFVNRVNAKELQQVGSGAGDAADRIQGWIQGHTKGQPIPPDILKDTLLIADLNEKAARRGYELKVQVNNKTHGGNVKPIDFATTSNDSAGTIRARDPQGKLHEAPAGTALPAGWKEEK